MNNNFYMLTACICKEHIRMYTDNDIFSKIFFDKKRAIRCGIDFFKYSELYKKEFLSNRKFYSDEFKEYFYINFHYIFRLEVYPREIVKDNRMIWDIIDDLKTKYKGKKLYNEVLKRIDIAVEYYSPHGECLSGEFIKRDSNGGNNVYYIREYDFDPKRTYKFKVGDIVTRTDMPGFNSYKIIYSPINIYTPGIKMKHWDSNYTLEGEYNGKYSFLDGTDFSSDYNLKLIST